MSTRTFGLAVVVGTYMRLGWRESLKSYGFAWGATVVSHMSNGFRYPFIETNCHCASYMRRHLVIDDIFGAREVVIYTSPFFCCSIVLA